MKLVVLYTLPADPEAFDAWYFGEHVPLVNQVPGLTGTVVTRFTRTLAGEGFYLMAELRFADKESRQLALRSAEMAAVAADANAHAAGLMTMMLGAEA